MEFRILGPLEVLEGDRALDLPGQRQRGLLALLLLHANQVVSSSRLIEELWPEEASESHAGALQASVSRLRKSLGPGAELLVTLPTGYVIRARAGAARPRPVRASRRGGRRRRATGGRRAAARGARALARPRARRLRLRAVRAGGDRAPRGGAPARGRDADRRRPRPRPPRRARRGARRARGRAPPARAPARPADARALPVGPSGRGAGRLPDRATRARRRAGDRAERGAAGAGARDPAPGSGARARADDGSGALDPASRGWATGHRNRCSRSRSRSPGRSRAS